MSDYLRDYFEFSNLESECIAAKQNRVGLLGGTFNPIHCGHISMANIALYEFSLGEVIFLPLGMPPHKREEYIAPSEQRLDMIRLAIADENRFSLSTIETARSGYTYTVDTLEMLTRTRKETDFYYIIGADTLFELTTWKNYERVFLLTDFVCVLRPGLDDAKVRQQAEKLNNQFGHKVHLAEERGPCISSTHIRVLAMQNEALTGLVPDSVARYIRENGVYRAEV
jgi:nicotinate-nucleotide adenylyltransferase